MAMWNPWRGCRKCSEGCLYCYIHKGDEKRGINTAEIVKTKDFTKPMEKKKNGADSFWYWDVGAFIFSGDETAVSVSGRDYMVTDRTIQENDIITIDLSPQKNNIWGDYARTLVFENGVLCNETDRIKNDEWRRGLQMEEYLHKALIDMAPPDMTFEELYYFMNDLIVKKGFLNLDFLGNLGHSIVKNINDRIYIEKGNHKK